MTPPARILLLRPDKAGDALKTLPVIRALRAVKPHLEIHVLASEHNASLFEAEPHVVTHELPSQWQQWRGPRLRNYLFEHGMPTAFDRVVNLLCDAFSEVDALLSILPSSNKFTVRNLPHHSPAGQDEIANIAQIVSVAMECDLEGPLRQVERKPVITDLDRAAASELLPVTDQSRFGICPFAGTAQRSHDLNRWRKFIRRMARSPFHREWVIFCPASLRAQAESLLPEGTAQIFRIVSPPSFRILAACFEKLDAVLAVDSGPLHLAQSMGIPVLGFLSGGDMARWFARLNPGDRLLRRGFLSRFPSYWEMWWAFRRWIPPLAHHRHSH